MHKTSFYHTASWSCKLWRKDHDMTLYKFTFAFRKNVLLMQWSANRFDSVLFQLWTPKRFFCETDTFLLGYSSFLWTLLFYERYCPSIAQLVVMWTANSNGPWFKTRWCWTLSFCTMTSTNQASFLCILMLRFSLCGRSKNSNHFFNTVKTETINKARKSKIVLQTR